MSLGARHLRLYLVAVALGHPRDASGVWPTFDCGTTGFIPTPDGEFADCIDVDGIARYELALGVT